MGMIDILKGVQSYLEMKMEAQEKSAWRIGGLSMNFFETCQSIDGFTKESERKRNGNNCRHIFLFK